MRRSLAFILPLALFIASAYRDVMYWDVGEMDTVPFILGIAHPPGMPLYVMVGWVFTHVIPFGSVAWRMSLLSALAVSAAAWIVAAIVIDETGDEDAGLAAALLFACGGIVWSHATRADAHALVVLAFAAIAWLLLRWYRTGSSRTFYAVCVAFGCGVAVHPVVAFALAGILPAVIARLAQDDDARVLLRGFAIAAAIVVVSFAYLPLRSGWIDALGLEPLRAYGLTGSAFWNYDDPARAENFLALVSGRDVSVGTARFGATNAAFTQGVTLMVREIAANVTLLGCVLWFAGLVALFRRDLTRAMILTMTLVPSAIFGCAFGAESDAQRYFLPLCALLAVAAGVACAAVPRLRAAALAGAAAAIAMLVLSQPHFFHQPFDDRAAVEAREVIAATPGDAIVVATWVIAPPLAYDAYVLHRTGGRAIVPAWYGDVENQLPGWMRAHPVFVAGTPMGSVTGYRLERMPTHTELYRVVRDSSAP